MKIKEIKQLMIDFVTNDIIFQSEHSSHKYQVLIEREDEEVILRIHTGLEFKYVGITYSEDDMEVLVMNAFDEIETMELILAKAKQEGKDEK